MRMNKLGDIAALQEKESFPQSRNVAKFKKRLL